MHISSGRGRGVLPSLFTAAALVTATSGGARVAAADQPVVIQGVVHDQYGKPPLLPKNPSRYVDQEPHISAMRVEPPMSGQDDHVVEVAAIEAEGRYRLSVSPGVWELEVAEVGGTAQPQIPLVDTRDTAGPVVQDVAIAQIDATLQGSVTGDGLDAVNPAHVAVQIGRGRRTAPWTAAARAG